jgi:hypothetical protein
LEASPIFAGSSAIFSVKACYFSQVNDPFSWSNPNLAGYFLVYFLQPNFL